MARPIKEGLDYFPLDIDFFSDQKIMMTEQEYGPKGGYIAVRLLCWVYKEGYYLKWDSKTALVLAKCVGDGVTGALVSEVVNALVTNEFFDKDLFNRCAILTSAGIQKRWLHIIKQLKRKSVIKSEYKLLQEETEVNTELTKVTTEETQAETEESTQKEMKGKGKENIPPTAREGEKEKAFTGPSVLIVREHPQRHMIMAKNHGIEHDEIPNQLKLFDQYHQQTAFADVSHMLNSWGIWCSKYLQKQQKSNNGIKKQQETTISKPKFSAAKRPEDYF